MKYNLEESKTEVIITDNLIDSVKIEQKKVFIIDSVVYKLQKKLISEITQKYPIYIYNASEQNKTLPEAENILQFLFDNKVNRSTIVTSIGGGITTDITAYAASVFKRGCGLQLIPTTFLAMIDAAIGGKTAVNFNGVKNTIGTFYPAEKVYVYPEFLQTLTKKQLNNGWAECIKTTLIQTSGLQKKIVEKFPEITKDILKETINIKMRICEKDLSDKGDRRKLNLGHTFAHIIETASDNAVSHGEAVLLGLISALKLSLQKNMISEDDFVRMQEILGLMSVEFEKIAQYKQVITDQFDYLLMHDKKANENVNLILFRGFCETVIQEEKDKELILKVLLENLL